jgi:4-hydroxymandelate oxidase
VLNSFCLPGHLKLGNFVNREASDVTKIEGKSGLESYVSSQMDAAVTWNDIDWLRSICSLPVVLKGIMTPEDARLAVQHEARGIVVSNHGGRQLDGVPATIEVLVRVVDAVRGECEVLLDGGIRRGTDVLKALALGARAILVGRPILWGLAVDGAAGARFALELLREELAAAMALVGCDAVDGLSPSLIWDSRRKGVLE